MAIVFKVFMYQKLSVDGNSVLLNKIGTPKTFSEISVFREGCPSHWGLVGTGNSQVIDLLNDNNLNQQIQLNIASGVLTIGSQSFTTKRLFNDFTVQSADEILIIAVSNIDEQP